MTEKFYSANLHEFLHRVERLFPNMICDADITNMIKQLPMLPEFPSIPRLETLHRDFDVLVNQYSPECQSQHSIYNLYISKIPPKTWTKLREMPEGRIASFKMDTLRKVLILMAELREDDKRHQDTYNRIHGVKDPEKKDQGGRKEEKHFAMGASGPGKILLELPFNFKEQREGLMKALAELDRKEATSKANRERREREKKENGNGGTPKREVKPKPKHSPKYTPPAQNPRYTPSSQIPPSNSSGRPGPSSSPPTYTPLPDSEELSKTKKRKILMAMMSSAVKDELKQHGNAKSVEEMAKDITKMLSVGQRTEERKEDKKGKGKAGG